MYTLVFILLVYHENILRSGHLENVYLAIFRSLVYLARALE